MSDVSQGPGWWIASDGQWYPPELHPDARAMAEVAASSAPSEQTTTSWAGAGSWEPSGVEGRENGVGVVPHWATPPGEALESPPVISNSATTVALPSTHPVTARPRREHHSRAPVLAVVIVVVLVVAGVLAYSMTESHSGSLAGDSPGQVVALAAAAAQKAGSVHVVVHLQSPGQTTTYIEDAAAGAGRQVITSSGGVQVTTLVVGGVAYVKANRTAMTTLFQLSDTDARRYAGTWLSFPSRGAAYRQIAENVTLVSLLNDATPSTSTAVLTQSVVDGRSVVGVRGELPGRLPGTLYVPATGSPLPLEEVTRSSGTVATTLFTDWGESVTVTPPTGAISGSGFASLFGTSGGSSGGTSSTTGGTGTSDRAAQSNLTNALTEVMALYQTDQTFCPASCAAGLTPLTLATIQSTAPEFTWSNGAATSANDVSIEPLDVTAPGHGDGVILAVRDGSTCWYAVELESAPTTAFADPGPDRDFPGSAGAGGTGPSETLLGAQKMGAGVYYATATVGGAPAGSPTTAQGCSAGFPVGSPPGGPATWTWGTSFSNAPNL
jgi:hypothetical protein